MLGCMQTTIRVAASNRDKLLAIAERDYGGATLDETVERLAFEHECHESLARLSDEERAEYVREGQAMADATMSDDLSDIEW